MEVSEITYFEASSPRVLANCFLAGPGLNELPFAVVQGPGTNSSASSSEKSTSPPAQDFEWIAHGDATARRRARAHVTRGFRRQKAAQAEQDKPKGKSKSQEIIERRKSEGARVVIASKDQPYDEAERSNASLSLALQPSLGQRSADAYPALPIDLSPATHALLDHCKLLPPQASTPHLEPVYSSRWTH